MAKKHSEEKAAAERALLRQKARLDRASKFNGGVSAYRARKLAYAAGIARVRSTASALLAKLVRAHTARTIVCAQNSARRRRSTKDKKVEFVVEGHDVQRAAGSIATFTRQTAPRVSRAALATMPE